MKKIILLLLAPVFFCNLYAQVLCRVAAPSGGPVFNYTNYNPAYNPNSYTLKIKFWLVGDDNGSNRFDPGQVNGLLDYINSVYNAFQIYFVNAGVTNLNSTTYNYLDYGINEYNALALAHETPNTINFYIIKDIIATDVIGVGHVRHAFIESAYAFTASTIHEIGHGLGLTHTKAYELNGSVSPGCEIEGGSNCGTCHDNLCDTNMTDVNYMYPFGQAGSPIFSEMQKNIAKNTIEFDRSGLMETVRTNYTPYIRKSDQLFNKYVCVNGYNNFDLVGNMIDQYPVVWSVSSNLSIFSVGTNRVTIKGLSNGTGTLTATFNGISVSASIKIGIPTNITATPYSSGYILSCSQPDYYQVDYVDLNTNQSGTTFLSLTTSTQYSGANYFYYLNPTHNFKFRLINFYNCTTPSDWVTVTGLDCSTQYPAANLFVTSQCGSTPGSQCGGIFTWPAVSGSQGYQVEYMIYNKATGLQVVETFTSSNTSMSYPAYASGQGPLYIKFRVKSKCDSSTWSEYSPWSSSFPW